MSYHACETGKKRIEYRLKKKLRYSCIQQLSSQEGVSSLCRWFEIERGSYYHWKKRSVLEQGYADRIRSMVLEVRRENPFMGLKKIYSIKRDELALSCRIGRDKFISICKKLGLQIKRKRKHVKTTQSMNRSFYIQDHYNGQTWTAPNQAWVSDITYIRTRQGFVYLFLTTDAYSRKIVGWELAPSMEAKWAVSVLNQGLKQRKGGLPIIHHSDRGFQYASKEFIKLLEENNGIPSMGEAGNCYDNALAERMNGILKNEYLLDSTFVNMESAKKAVKQAIFNYNNCRPHWGLQLRIPAMVHAAA